jgi:hypothetical protein
MPFKEQMFISQTEGIVKRLLMNTRLILPEESP